MTLFIFVRRAGRRAVHEAGCACSARPPLVCWLCRHRHRRRRFCILSLAHRAQTYLLYLCDDGISTYQFAHRQRPDWEERMDIFAGYVVDAVRNSGRRRSHCRRPQLRDLSLPSMCSTARSRAIRRSAATDHGCACSPSAPIADHRFPSAGAVVPRPHPAAGGRGRHRLGRLPVAPRHHEFLAVRSGCRSRYRVQSRPAQSDASLPISFRDLWVPGNFGRRRWRFFRAHFQFLLANERLGAAYDYYLICCGPLDLMTRGDQPDEAVAAIAAKIGTISPLHRRIELPAIAGT